MLTEYASNMLYANISFNNYVPTEDLYELLKRNVDQTKWGKVRDVCYKGFALKVGI